MGNIFSKKKSKKQDNTAAASTTPATENPAPAPVKKPKTEKKPPSAHSSDHSSASDVPEQVTPVATEKPSKKKSATPLPAATADDDTESSVSAVAAPNGAAEPGAGEDFGTTLVKAQKTVRFLLLLFRYLVPFSPFGTCRFFPFDLAFSLSWIFLISKFGFVEAFSSAIDFWPVKRL